MSTEKPGYFAALFERMKQKGGNMHFSLARGAVVNINGEPSRQLVRSMPELLSKPKPDVIILGCDLGCDL